MHHVLEKTIKLFVSVYYLAQNNCSFSGIEGSIQLQIIDATDLEIYRGYPSLTLQQKGNKYMARNF